MRGSDTPTQSAAVDARLAQPGCTVVLPGQPDDDNRDYLPEYLKGSRIVVNENGNNSQPYPQGLTEHEGILADDLTDRWYLYVPTALRENPHIREAVPLVVAVHGGMMTGWAQAVYTSWVNVAEREGFIVVFPDAHSRRFWTVELTEQARAEMTSPTDDGLFFHVPPERIEDNHDLRFFLALIEWCAQRYPIDRGRIFMQGMSMGNMMTHQFARYFGHVLAGAAGSAGPSPLSLIFDAAGKPINRSGPLAIWQTRCDLDGVLRGENVGPQEVQRANREYWLTINGIDSPPEITIQGDDNLAFYRGAHADLVFRDVRNRDHGQTFDDAELVWDYLFSGTRRLADGRVHTGQTLRRRQGDSWAVAVADGCSQVWIHGHVRELGGEAFLWRKLKYHGLGGDALVRGEYVYVPVDFLAEVFGGQVAYDSSGEAALLTLDDGQTFQIARGVIGCVRNGRMTSMLAEPVLREGRLWISLEWFASYVMNLHCSQRRGVLYITDHYANLSENMAVLLSDLLA